ncbi:MAG: hypothetical protein ACRD2R_04810, partial [Terriglobales bacterium]
MSSRRAFWFLTLFLILGLPAAAAPTRAVDPGEKVLIRAAKPYGALVARIEALGGRVTYQYRYVNAIAAEVPRPALTSLRDMVGTAAITKDEIIALPGNVDTLRGRNLTPSSEASQIAAASVQALSATDVQSIAAANPNGYLVNLGFANVSSLQASGVTGSG